MCARMTALTYDEALAAVRAIRMGVLANPFPDWPAAPTRKDAFPQSWVPVAVPVGGVPEDLDVMTLNWGYPVPWRPAPVFNTRIESIMQGAGMWRDSADRRRCVIPTLRFYERHATQALRNPRTGRQVRQMYAFQLADEPVTWLAGVYEQDHFSVVTTQPNEEVAPVHDRMPLVLRQSELPAWLGEGFVRLADRSQVMLRVSAEELPPAPGLQDQQAGDEQLSLF